MSLYSYHPTVCFENKLKKIEKHDTVGYKRIQKVIERILNNPEDADGRMRGQHHSRFKKYVGRRDYRLIYEWCSICEKTSIKLENRCEKCGKISDDSVVFFDVFHKNEV